jgi:hypothetical protein
MTSQRETSYRADFEEEMLRLMQENNKLLQSIDEKLRKVVMNTSNAR